jgi:hypothetical protein
MQLLVMKIVVMTFPARCKKCGGPILSVGLLSGSDLCMGCARIETARRMSLTLE